MPDIRSEICRRFNNFDDLNKFKVNLLHEEKSEIEKNILLDATHLQAVTLG